MLLHKTLNRHLDSFVQIEVRLHHRCWLTFRICGYTGLALAVVLAMCLVTDLGLSLWVMTGIVLAGVLTFFSLAMVTKIITGEERLTYYHHQIAVLVVAAVLLRLLCQPILPYLDVTILGVGMFLACGRVGCLMAGCCHGRPHRWGVCYREEHAAAGFTPYFVGVRLFPIQAMESLLVFCIVLVGSTLLLSSYPPGEALAWYVVAYGAGRFCFEFVRGDPERPYLWGFSEAQWTSLALMCAVVWAGLFGVLAFRPWYVGATAGLALAMIAVALIRRLRRTARYQLLHPHHVKEVAEAVERVSNLAAEGSAISKQNPVLTDIHIGCTFLGIQISASKNESTVGCIDHYALSYRNGIMTEETARTLGELILQLKHLSGSNELINGNRGVFHLLIHPLTRGEQHRQRAASAGSAEMGTGGNPNPVDSRWARRTESGQAQTMGLETRSRAIVWTLER